MNVLIIGKGGREHAISWKVAQSERVNQIYCIPGNGGIADIAECKAINISDHHALIEFAQTKNIDLTIVGPEVPLAQGIVDHFEANGLRIFGPSKDATLIESSKIFSKNLMKKYGIPTPDFHVFEDDEHAVAFLRSRDKFPVVIKAEGLAAGKGVIIANNQKEGLQTILGMMIEGQFGEAGERIVIEDFWQGTEISVLSFTDGKTIVPMVSAKDYKKIGEGDTGLNTGGMGAISPNPIYTPEIAQECMENIFQPTVDALNQEGRKFKGVLYFGLILTDDGLKVLEYNARFGDPEAQVVLPRLNTDLVEIMEAVIDERLEELEIEWREESACTVVMASRGYPEAYERGFEITGIENVTESAVFQAGTIQEDNALLTNGGRILAVTGCGKTLDNAIQKAYQGIEKIHFDNKYYRRDIGS